MKNLSIENITKACRGTFHGDESILSQEVSGVVIDSRKVQPGYLFVAIDGERVNAHKFIPDTVKAGAMCVVSHEDLGETDFPYILVESTGQALLDIAKLYRDSFDMKVVGITGSVGKTSTKEMIASVLAQKYHVHKTLGNFNNEWGLPITIFDMPEDTEVAVLEMGVNHFGDLTRSLVEEASKGANTEALWFADNESFIQAIPDIIKDGDNVLVKASHGMNFPQIVHALEEL